VSDANLIMQARYIADQVRLGKKTMSAGERLALADGFRACDAQRAEFARAKQDAEAKLASTKSPLDEPAIEVAEAEDLVEQLGDWLNHEAMDSGDPGGKLRDFAGAVTRLLGRFKAVERVVEAAVEWNDAEVGEENVNLTDDRPPAIASRQRTDRAINNLRDVTAMYRADADADANADAEALSTLPAQECT